MSAVLDKVQSAFTSVTHDQPQIWHKKKILLAVTSAAVQMPDHRSGFFWGELLHPYQVFTQNGWDVDIVSETGAAIPDEASIGKMGSATDLKFWEDKQYPLHLKLQHIRPAGQITSAEEYSAFFVAGGHACCADLPTARNLQSLAARIYESGGVVGAVCHGIALFQNLKLSNGANILAGKQATGFSKKGEESMEGVMDWMKQHGYHTMEEVVLMCGGKWSEPSNPMGEHVITDDRVVTGVNPASAKGVAESMLKYLPQDKEFEPTKADSSVSSSLGLSDKNRVPTDTAEKGRTYQGERTTV